VAIFQLHLALAGQLPPW